MHLDEARQWHFLWRVCRMELWCNIESQTQNWNGDCTRTTRGAWNELATGRFVQ